MHIRIYFLSICGRSFLNGNKNPEKSFDNRIVGVRIKVSHCNTYTSYSINRTGLMGCDLCRCIRPCTLKSPCLV